MRTLIAGASGFIGSALTQRLAAQGHDVVAVGRRSSSIPTGARIHPTALDVGDLERTTAALQDVGCAFYLVHSLGAPGGFVDKDYELAATFANAAAAAGVKRIVYLGGLGSGELSAHLRSRQEVGEALASTGLDVVELRAAVILGAGSVSFEMMRYLVERLPTMVCPRWVQSPIQPIAVSDVLAYLDEARTVAPGVYEIGGTVTTYREMMQRYAHVRGIPQRLIVDIPFLTLKLSSYWVDFVTPVDQRISHSLIESLSVPVVVQDAARTNRAFTIRPKGIEEAFHEALDAQVVAVDKDITTMPTGLQNGVHVLRRWARITPRVASAIRDDLGNVGGDLAWYGIETAWRARFLLGLFLGEQHPIARPPELLEGAAVDWWRVTRWDGKRLVLRADWRPGEAWLGFSVEGDFLKITAGFRPRGVLGTVYWALLGPVHRLAFVRMVRRRLRRAKDRLAIGASDGA